MTIINSTITNSSVDIGSGKYELTLWDLFGNPVKVIHLNKGDTYTLPPAPALDKCTFAFWVCCVPAALNNGVITMPNYPIDCVPVYRPTSGYDEFDVHITNNLGSGLTDAPQRTIVVGLDAGQVIDWGDGNTETIASSDMITHQYASEGDYTIKRTGGTGEYGVSLFRDDTGVQSPANNYYNTYVRAVRLASDTDLSHLTNFPMYYTCLMYVTGTPSAVAYSNGNLSYTRCCVGIVGTSSVTNSGILRGAGYGNTAPLCYTASKPFTGTLATAAGRPGGVLKHFTWPIVLSTASSAASCFNTNSCIYSGGVIYFPFIVRGDFVTSVTSPNPQLTAVYLSSFVYNAAINYAGLSDLSNRGILKQLEDETNVTFTFTGVSNLSTFEVWLGDSESYVKTYTSSDLVDGKLTIPFTVYCPTVNYRATKTDTTTVTGTLEVGVTAISETVDLS